MPPRHKDTKDKYFNINRALLVKERSKRSSIPYFVYDNKNRLISQSFFFNQIRAVALEEKTNMM